MRAPRLLAPDALDRCLTALRDVSVAASNVSGGSMSAWDYLVNFMSWHVNAEAMLSASLAPDELRGLLYSPRYWALRGMDATAPSLIAWIELELRVCGKALDEAAEALTAAKRRWRGDDATLVMPDTNLLLHHEKTMSFIPWRELADADGAVRVVVPLQVIDELDRLKRTGRDEVRARARKSLAELSAASIVGTENRHPLQESPLTSTTLEVLADGLEHVRLPDADSEIVDRAAALGELAGGRVVVMTSDVGMQVRAGEASVDVRLVATKERP